MRVQNDVLHPALPQPIGPVVQRRFDQGNAFEASAISQLEGLVAAAQVIDAAVDDELDALVVDQVTLLLGARLPLDVEGRRVGRPDMLVVGRGGGFRAVDIKHHMVLDATAPNDPHDAALISTLDRPILEDASPDEMFFARRREGDLLQLAHYQRILEAAGLAAEGGRWGGILGTERRIIWFDLDAPMWRGPSGTQSSMERYDSEFEFRLEVIAAAQAYRSDPSVDLLAMPLRIGECDECPWWDYCRGRLQSGTGDISLLPRLGRREWKIHHDHGVTDRAALARLDPLTARLVSGGIDVVELQRLVEGLPDDTPVSDLGVVVRAKAQLTRLAAEGVSTFGHLMQLDPGTTTYFNSGMSSLPDQIDMARAALGPSPIYRRRGVDELRVPRGDIEVDVDMENIEEGVYLWGALHTVRQNGVTTSTYRSFVTWEPLSPLVEVQNFSEFWNWLQEVRTDARRRGQTFRAYCYNASAENTYLRKLGVGLGVLDDVSIFIESDEWVDLLRVVDGQLITGTGSGLKAIAPLTGFAWSVDDPGGGISMVRYDIAAASIDSKERQEARDWLLTYNRGDVEATLAIRDWLESAAEDLPSIAILRASDFSLSNMDAVS
ncbi:MAG: ribonuclease H-like domain-containing protein [Acidimicrobiales bacterium]